MEKQYYTLKSRYANKDRLRRLSPVCSEPILPPLKLDKVLNVDYTGKGKLQF